MLNRRSRFVITAMVFAFAFLYIPIVSVVAYSFNESRMVTIWSGFSLKWWQALPENEEMVSAALLSLQIGVVNATSSLTGIAGATILSQRGFCASAYGRSQLPAAPSADVYSERVL